MGWEHDGVSDSVVLRELPDGGHEFVLEDPVLRALEITLESAPEIDGAVILRFGRTEVTVSGAFALEVDGVAYRLDPCVPESLAPLLSCIPGAARWVWASPDGRLTVELMQGQRLVAPGPALQPWWSVGDRSG
jgi:hypothetical protein